ncbi:MBL fold metallo-hydrolase [Antrihabitans sp. YC3-6]|uniref:MBL fold metallo-hydrolase n=1 Tax=Antrihabitans stalagmiti TaxID=2799499 RepID=A0A934U5C6_9NOCA|nr:MBL fold metallo-hydrolase [Antrihabitans stalagmiti]MBJ8341222.1 MBL fold metallo-hydrolase [Antrihabitans stalagmiti]
MTPAIRLEVLPARQGDCLLVECPSHDGGRTWRMLVDGGPVDTWPRLEARLNRFPTDDNRIDVAVVTHIDADHIGGFLPFANSKFAHEQVGDYWFNGRVHLPGSGVTRSVAQGESLTADLRGDTNNVVLPWNRAFCGLPIDTGEEAGFVEVQTANGPRITVLSPTTKRLAILGAKWREAVDAATRGPTRAAEPDVLQPLSDLEAIASSKSVGDSSAPNGSSIALLIEHRGASVVLAGDGFGTVIGAALLGVAQSRGLDELAVDAFKLPHHGSKGNVIAPMLAVAPARHYLVSTNGDIFHHPDDVAIARTVVSARQGATLWFNYRTPRTARWTDPKLTAQFGYAARYPDEPAKGIILELPARQ